MIFNYCSYCGYKIKEYIPEGMFSCLNCERLIKTECLFHRLCSVAWFIIKTNCKNKDELIKKTKIKNHEAIIAFSFIEENCYSVEEFQKILKIIGIKDD